jgi:hypothetical protein
MGFWTMLKYVIAVSLMATTAANANSYLWINYSQWERLPKDMRTAYVAGAFDTLAGVASDERQMKISTHYSECMSKSGMELDELATHVLTFAQTRPDLQGGTVQGVLINYLIGLCGKPSR